MIKNKISTKHHTIVSSTIPILLIGVAGFEPASTAATGFESAILTT
jgi:hypothetical protein